MKKSDTTARFPQAFASQADSSVVAYPLPDTKQASGRVSLLNGFPLENFTALSAGGVPPSGADFNGLFRTLTEAIRANEAGQIRAFNANYAQKIGGYPQSALVTDPANPARLLISTQDDNKTNPASDTSGAWVPVADGISALQDGLNDEKQARENADNGLSNDLANERSARGQGDAGLQTAINAERTRATNAESGKVSKNGDTINGDLVLNGNSAGNNYYGRTLRSGVPDARAQATMQLLGGRGRPSNAVGVSDDNGNLHNWLFNADNTITAPGGNAIPEVIGKSGRVVIQTFTAYARFNQSNPARVLFPVSFAPGTTPTITITPTTEVVGGRMARCCYGIARRDAGGLEIDNAGFSCTSYALDTTSNSSGENLIPITAIGIMQ